MHNQDVRICHLSNHRRNSHRINTVHQVKEQHSHRANMVLQIKAVRVVLVGVDLVVHKHHPVNTVHHQIKEAMEVSADHHNRTVPLVKVKYINCIWFQDISYCIRI